MAELKTREFAQELIRQGGMKLSKEASDDIRYANSVEEAQQMAYIWGIEPAVIKGVADEQGVEVTVKEILNVTNVGSDADIAAQAAAGGPANIAPEEDETVEVGGDVSPLGATTAAINTALTPDEIANLEGAELDAWLAGGGEEPEEDERGYLLPEGVDPDQLTEMIALPSYQYGYGEGQTARAIANPVIYRSGDELTKWAGYSPQSRAAYTKAMVDAGMIDEEAIGGYERKLTPQEKRLNWEREQRGEDPIEYGYKGTEGGLDPSGVSSLQVDAYRQALGTAGYLGTNPMSAIKVWGANDKAAKARSGGGGGGGGGRAPFVVPASLRTIPDYESLQQNVTDMMRGAMGRKPEDWEITMLADEMQSQHKERNKQLIDASRAAWEQGNRGVGQEIEVPEPTARTQKYLEDTWEDELSRRKDVGERSQTNQLMMQSLTQGARMVGG